MSRSVFARSWVTALVALCLLGGVALAGSQLMQVSRAYRKAIMKVRQDPVQAIPVHLEYAVKATEAAKADNNPNYMGFTGGPEKVQYLTEARTALDKLIAERGKDDSDVVHLSALYDETWAKVAAMCSGFNEQKLESERAPEDVYQGSDRQQLETMLRAAWKEQYPDDEVLDVRFHMAEWERDAGKKWHEIDKAWSAYDKSVLATSFIVKTSANVATVYPAYVNKDNLANGKLTIGVDTKGSEYVHREVLIKNLAAAD